MKTLEERVKEVAQILAEWNHTAIGQYDEGHALYRISKVLHPEFILAWRELLSFQKKRVNVVEPLLIKTGGQE